MKIQRGIVKYKDRNDIVCTYALTDDGKQYYFLDENDEKKFSNGNRIATTALVEAVDPNVKSANVGVIDGNGVPVIPFENRSIRPVNDNVIIVEKAVPTSPSVVSANEMRNDPAAAAQLVSTPATIKDKINAQMGTEGKYLFNDQFSEATVCDISGTNLVGGETYSFISQANDKLYLSKNTADTPVSEFSLTTYEMLAAPVATEAPVEATPAEAAPAVPTPEAAPIDVSTTVVDQQVIEGALASQATDVAVPAAPEGAPVEAAPTDVAPAEATEEPKHLIMTYNDSLSTVQDVPAETTETKDETVADITEAMAAATGATPIGGDVPADAPVDAPAETTGEVDFATAETESKEEAPVDAPTGEFSTSDTSISDDLKAFADGFSADEDAPKEEAPVDETTKEETTENEVTEEAPAEETTNEEETTAEEKAEEEVPPIVEEDEKEEVTEEAKEGPVEDKVEEEPVEETADVKEETFSDAVKAMPEDEDTASPVTIDAETVLATVDRNKNGIIDSNEIMVPQKVEQEEPKPESVLSDIFATPKSTGFRNQAPAPSYSRLPSYPTESYATPSTYGREYSSFGVERTPERMGYSSYETTGSRDNVIGDAARYMSELIREIRDLRSANTQYQGKVENLESENRSLTGKLRALDEASDRLQAKNQSLETKVHELETMLATSEERVKTMAAGKQDLARMLADASAVLGPETKYGGYNDEFSYLRRAA